MKLLLENWRKFVNEQNESMFGVFVKYEPGYTIELSLIDLSIIKAQLSDVNSMDEFVEKLNDKSLYDKAVVGYIFAGHNPMYSKAAPSMGGSGGHCAGTYSVRKSIGRGYGKQLYDALLGFASGNNVYIAADRHSVSTGAKSRWTKIDTQTDDEVSFDDFENPKTEPKDDDCMVHNVDALDKGFKDEKTVDYYKKLRYNLDRFFETEIEPLFDEPGFFGKLFGQTPANKAEKLKKKLLKLGDRKFRDFEMRALKDPSLR